MTKTAISTLQTIGYGRGDDTAERIRESVPERMPTQRETVASHFKAIARERKCGKLLAHLDESAEVSGLKPHTEDAATIAAALATWGGVEWRIAADEAGVNYPSDEVRDMVICIYRERAKG